MIKMWKLILLPYLIFFSFSERTPYVQPNPMDYEVAVGVENNYYELELEYEREDGMFFANNHLLVQNLPKAEWLEIELNKKADTINEQALRLVYKPFPDAFIFRNMKIGAVYSAYDWGNHKLLLNFSYKSGDDFKINMDL